MIAHAKSNREFGAGEFTSYVIAAFAPSVIYDAVGLVAAVLRAGRDDPRGVLAVLKDLWPWGRK